MKKYYAFIEASYGPTDKVGVRLAYCNPSEEYYSAVMEKMDPTTNEYEVIKNIREKKRLSGSPYFFETIDWWDSKSMYEKNAVGIFDYTKDNIMDRRPEIVVVASKEEAIEMTKNDRSNEYVRNK